MRLTLPGKVAAMVIAASAAFIAWTRLESRTSPTPPPAIDAAQHLPAATAPAEPTEAVLAAPLPGKPKALNRIVVGVDDLGGGYPGVVTNDGSWAGPRSRFAVAGLEVEIKLITDPEERLAAFDAGEVDVILETLDGLARLAPGYQKRGIELRAFLMADWSRGNLGIVAKPELKNIESLARAKVATRRSTPGHYFLLSMLERSNLTAGERETVESNLVSATKTPLASELFKRGEVDAVALREPQLSECGAGQLLVSTSTATHLVAEVLFARADWLEAHQAEIVLFTRAWFEGVAQLERNPAGSAATLASAFRQTPAQIRIVLSKIKPASFADNRALFGLEGEHAPYLALFDGASRLWQREGIIQQPAPAAATRYLKALEVLAQEHSKDKVVEPFSFGSGPREDRGALLTRSVSIDFGRGSDRLDPDAEKRVDSLAPMLAEFGNAYVRIEGNTDSAGARAVNRVLSRRRAATLVEYLVTQHGYPRERFQAVGNGPDKPVADNHTEEGRRINRRTDFLILPNF